MAFAQVAALDGFQTLSQEEAENILPKEYGKIQATIYGNSEPRDKVMQILRQVNCDLFYSEFRTDNDKIRRCYIGRSSDGKPQLLFCIVGRGGNDLLVALCTGGKVADYEKLGDELKEHTFEELEESIVKVNAECPMVLGPTIEITSMSLTREQWTMRVKINTLGQGFTEAFMGEAAKDNVKTLLSGFGKENIVQIFNHGVDFKMVYTSETGDSRTIVLSHCDLAEILNATDVTPEQSLQLYIDNNSSACPVDLQNGMSQTAVYMEGDVLYHEITMSEALYSLDALTQNAAALKQNTSGLISGQQDAMVVQLATWLVQAGKGLGYVYKGDKSGKAVKIVLPCDELRNLLPAN